MFCSNHADGVVPAARVEVGHHDALVERATRHRLGHLVAPLAQPADRGVDLAAAHLEDGRDELALLARAHAGLEQLARVDQGAGQAQAVDQQRAAGQVAQDRRHEHQAHAAADRDGADEVGGRALPAAAPRGQRADREREIGRAASSRTAADPGPSRLSTIGPRYAVTTMTESRRKSNSSIRS